MRGSSRDSRSESWAGRSGPDHPKWSREFGNEWRDFLDAADRSPEDTLAKMQALRATGKYE